MQLLQFKFILYPDIMCTPCFITELFPFPFLFCLTLFKATAVKDDISGRRYTDEINTSCLLTGLSVS